MSKWKVGDVCEGQFSEDEQWYKARIDEVLGEGRYMVTYTEYGNSEETEDQFLRPLPGAAAPAAPAPAPAVAAPAAAPATPTPAPAVAAAAPAAKWKVGDFCEGQYSEDDQWYKARIDEVLGDGRYVVTYPEYGNQEETEEQFLRPLPGGAAAAAAAAPAIPTPAPAAAAPAAAPPASKWKVGDVCEGQFSEDEQWYKARIDEVLGGGRYFVTYTEYGNSEETEDQFLRPLAGGAAAAVAPSAAAAAAAPVVEQPTAVAAAPVAESAAATTSSDADAWGSSSSAPATDSFSNEKEATDTLFIGGMSFQSTEQSITDFFSPYGEIISARLATDRDTGKPRGFGYVQFASIESAKAAFAAANGETLDGRQLRLDYAQSKPGMTGSRPPRPSMADGGSFGGGSGGAGGADDKSNTDTIFVGSVPDDATEEDLRAIGEQFGMIVGVRVPRDRDTGAARGIGYIQYGDAATTQAAYRGLFGAQLKGVSVRIDYARPSREFDPTKAPANPPSVGGGYGAGAAAPAAAAAPPTLHILDHDAATVLRRNRALRVVGGSISIERTF